MHRLNPAGVLCLFVTGSALAGGYQLPPATAGMMYTQQVSPNLKGHMPFQYRLEKQPMWLSISPGPPPVLSGMAPAMPGIVTFDIVVSDGSMPPKVTRTSVKLTILAGSVVVIPEQKQGRIGPADLNPPPADANPGAAPMCAMTMPVQVNRPRITSRLVEGAKNISGLATPTTAGQTPPPPMPVTTNIWITTDAGDPVQLSTTTGRVLTDNQGFFSADLAFPLNGGQSIIVHQSVDGVMPALAVTNACATSDTQTVRSLADWGRVKAYFAGGIVLARDNNNFASTSDNQSIFLSFDVDKNWLWSPPEPHGWNRIMFNTFFETRLTSIPVAEKPPAAANPPSGGGATPATPPDTLSTFLVSQKAASLQAGAYFPLIISNWEYQKTPNSIFIAPISKIGFTTPVTAPDANAVNPDRFYVFYGWGGRVGHYRMSRTRNEAPELLSYLDVIVGRWGNLPVTLSAPLHDSKGAPVLDAQGNPVLVDLAERRFRIGIEGLLKVPTTPFVVGFSANIGQNFFSQNQKLAAKDDLRFFFGAKFDVGRLLGKLQLP